MKPEQSVTGFRLEYIRRMHKIAELQTENPDITAAEIAKRLKIKKDKVWYMIAGRSRSPPFWDKLPEDQKVTLRPLKKRNKALKTDVNEFIASLPDPTP